MGFIEEPENKHPPQSPLNRGAGSDSPFERACPELSRRRASPEGMPSAGDVFLRPIKIIS